MEIIKVLGTLKDNRTALIIKDAYNPNYVLARGFDEQDGTWDSATYFDGNLVAFAKEVIEIEEGIHFDRLLDLSRTISDELISGTEDWYREEIPDIVGASDEEAVILGLKEDDA